MADTKENRKKREYGDKRNVILEGAIKVFTKNGFNASSMDEVAEVSGVSKRTIYNHFFSKENLFQTIVADFLCGRNEIKPIEYSRTVPINEQLKKFIHAELYFIDDPIRRDLSKLLISTSLMDIEFANATRSHYQPHSKFITWLNAAKEGKSLKFDSPELAARVFYGLLVGSLIWPALLTDGESLKYATPVFDEIISVFLCSYGV